MRARGRHRGELRTRSPREHPRRLSGAAAHVKLSRNTKRRLVFYGGLLAVFTASALFCSSMPGRSVRGALPPLDAREERYQAELRQSVDALSVTIGARNLDR